ncbi:MAG: general secretion pathway protein GspB [Desulfobulbaceae bacterium]|nr:general secretion pathway protein GspB [Desulfobulbaceae bacterium]
MLEEPPRRPGWLYGLAAILLLNAAGIGWWLWQGTPAKTPVAQAPAPSEIVAKATPQTTPQTTPAPPPPQASKIEQPPAAPAQVANAPTAPANKSPYVLADSPKPQAAAATPPPSPTPTAQPVAVTGNAGQVAANQPTTPPPPPTPKRTAAPPIPANPPPVIATPEKSTPPVTASAQKTTPPATPAASKPAAQKTPPVAMVPIQQPADTGVSAEEPLDEGENDPEIAASGDHLSPIAASAPPPKNSRKADKTEEDSELSKIPLLNQLPPDIQQGLPELHISFHSYSIKAAARLVSISGKILHEGDSFDADVKLETITTKGVIMKVKDRRFQIQVNPSR